MYSHAINVHLECPDCKQEFSNSDVYRVHRCSKVMRVGEKTIPFNARVGDITVKQGRGALSPEMLSARVLLRELSKRVISLCHTNTNVPDLVINTYHIISNLREIGNKLGWKEEEVNAHPILVMLSGRIGAITKSDQMRNCVQAEKEVQRLASVL